MTSRRTKNTGDRRPRVDSEYEVSTSRVARAIDSRPSDQGHRRLASGEASRGVWFDAAHHSDSERRKVLEAIDRFKETDTRDELGLAPIRDGFADHFFPGTGVLMTRSRYFLFVP